MTNYHHIIVLERTNKPTAENATGLQGLNSTQLPAGSQKSSKLAIHCSNWRQFEWPQVAKNLHLYHVIRF